MANLSKLRQRLATLVFADSSILIFVEDDHPFRFSEPLGSRPLEPGGITCHVRAAKLHGKYLLADNELANLDGDPDNGCHACDFDPAPEVP